MKNHRPTATKLAGRKKLFILPFLLIVLLSCTPDAHWVMFRGEQSRGYTSTSIDPPIGIKWKQKLQDQPGRDRSFNPPIVVDNTIFFGSSDSNFYALDVESGYMR